MRVDDLSCSIPRTGWCRREGVSPDVSLPKSHVSLFPLLDLIISPQTEKGKSKTVRGVDAAIGYAESKFEAVKRDSQTVRYRREYAPVLLQSHRTNADDSIAASDKSLLTWSQC